MIPFIAHHPLTALALVFVGSLILALFVGGICAAAGRADEARELIEPGELNDVPVTASVAVELSNLGFDVKAWDSHFLQITDANATTFYMPNTATLEQCLTRHQEKLEQFKAT